MKQDHFILQRILAAQHLSSQLRFEAAVEESAVSTLCLVLQIDSSELTLYYSL
jgi:hypothetical protein